MKIQKEIIPYSKNLEIWTNILISNKILNLEQLNVCVKLNKKVLD